MSQHSLADILRQAMKEADRYHAIKGTWSERQGERVSIYQSQRPARAVVPAGYFDHLTRDISTYHTVRQTGEDVGKDAATELSLPAEGG